MRVFERLLNIISQFLMILSGGALVVMTVIFGWLVFGRYVLNSTPTWVEQVSLLLVVLIGFLGAAVGVHEETHLGVSIFRNLSPTPIRKLFEFSSHLIMAVFGLVMAINSYELTLFKWETQIPLLHVPEGLRTLPILICGILVFLYSCNHLIQFLKHLSEPNQERI